METSKPSKEGSGASASASASTDEAKSQKQRSKRSIYDDSDSLLTVDPSQYKKFGRVSGPTASRSSSSSSGPLFKPTWTDADEPKNTAVSSSVSTIAGGKDKEGKTSRNKEKDNAMMKKRAVAPARTVNDSSNNGSIIVMIVLLVIGMPLFVEDVLSRGLEQTNVSYLHSL